MFWRFALADGLAGNRGVHTVAGGNVAGDSVMIGVVAKLKIQDGKQAEFEQVAKDLMAKVKANEPGCLTYQLYKTKGSSTDYIFMEQYASSDALKAHGQTDYFKAAGPKLGAVLGGAPEIAYYDIVE
jgi:quinol monooxygenase YgiN